MSRTSKIAVIMGSESDLPVMEQAVEVLERFGVPFEVHVLSAHRSPEAVAQFARDAESRGLQVLIAGAGGAAHLAGALSAHTTLPVIGVPIPTDQMGGMDSLLSTVQMPAGVPVACMGLGESGAGNSAVMAIEILAVADADLGERLHKYKEEMVAQVQDQDSRLQQWLKDRRR